MVTSTLQMWNAWLLIGEITIAFRHAGDMRTSPQVPAGLLLGEDVVVLVVLLLGFRRFLGFEVCTLRCGGLRGCDRLAGRLRTGLWPANGDSLG